MLRLRERIVGEFAFFVSDSNPIQYHQPSDDLYLLLYSKSDQRDPDDGPSATSQEQALLEGVIENQRIPYQMGLIRRFLTNTGISPKRIRFREQLNPPDSLTEAWDAEIKIADDWIELAGVAQRKLPNQQIFNTNMKNITSKEDVPAIRSTDIRISEISVGLTRLIEVLLRLTFTSPSGNDREYFALPASVAPSIMAVCTVNHEYNELASDITTKFRKSGCRVSLEQSGSIGKQYARQDARGTPYCATVDSKTASTDTVTLRERDSKQQIRLAIQDLFELTPQLRASDFEFTDITLD